MFLYHVGGALLRSDLPLLSLLPAAERDAQAAPPERSLALIAEDAPLGEPDRWLYTERFPDTSEPWRAVGVAPGGRRLVRLFGHADFLLDRDARAVRVFAFAAAPPAAIEPLFLEQVLPLFWSLLGRPCLHAGAVARGAGEAARAAAFAGRSGSGKSTLASCLAAAGGRLLADDCLVIEPAGEGVLAHPGHRAVRLLADSAQALFASPTAGEPSADGSKRRLDLPARAPSSARPVPLARIYVLEPLDAAASAPRIEALRPRDAVAHLAASLFRIDPADRSRLPDELALLLDVASRTVVARLGVPRRYDALPAVRDAIAADLGI